MDFKSRVIEQVKNWPVRGVFNIATLLVSIAVIVAVIIEVITFDDTSFLHSTVAFYEFVANFLLIATSLPDRIRSFTLLFLKPLGYFIVKGGLMIVMCILLGDFGYVPIIIAIIQFVLGVAHIIMWFAARDIGTDPNVAGNPKAINDPESPSK
eukprot:TRINITY_DN2086_c0_g1_i1.p1 TRINITY_DN2086_c0_g1~~TRINITY_DN2086_c0_g1_i1.p1  ORF type:complete len:153 (-),score=25.63 TRINITY_DN2086_c0_g1_i1:36-494(-)